MVTIKPDTIEVELGPMVQWEGDESMLSDEFDSAFKSEDENPGLIRASTEGLKILKISSHFNRRQVSLLNTDYNPHAWPPDFGAAARHGIATLVSNIKEEDENNLDVERWPWCHYPLEIQRFSVWKTNNKDLGLLGCGFTLYYDLIKGLTIMMMIWFGISFFALYDNYTAGKEKEWDEELEGHWLISGTIAAHGTESHPSIYQAWLNAVMSWTCLVIYVKIHLRSKNIVRQLTNSLITPADFTLYIRNIPRHAKKQDIQDWITKYGVLKGMEAPEIYNINLVYDNRMFIKYDQKHADWRTKYEHAPEEHGALLTDGKKECERKMKKYHAKLKKLEEQIEDGSIPFMGKAFVTFMYENNAQVALETLTRPKRLDKWITQLRHLLWFYVRRSRKKLLGKKVIVERPEEPIDILWKNLPDDENNWKIRIKTGIATLWLLAICFAVVYASAQWKKFLKEQHDDELSEHEKRELTVIILMPPFVVAGVNALLAKTIKFITRKEKFDTITDQYAAVAIKLTTTMFVNTAIIGFIVYRKVYYGQASLVVEMSAIIVINCAIQPLIQFFNIGYLCKKIRQWREQRKGVLSHCTQQEANTLFQGPQKDMALRYAYLIKTYLLVMMYGPIIPIAYPIAAISFFVEYWVDKYILLRRLCRPENIGKNLNKTISRFIPVGVFLNWLGSMIFHYNYNEETLIPTVTGLVISFVFLLTPWVRFIKLKSILEYSKNIQSNNLGSFRNSEYKQNLWYEHYRHLFIKDYDRENPITARKAIKEWSYALSDKIEDKKEKEIFGSICSLRRSHTRDGSQGTDNTWRDAETSPSPTAIRKTVNIRRFQTISTRNQPRNSSKTEQPINMKPPKPDENDNARSNQKSAKTLAPMLDRTRRSRMPTQGFSPAVKRNAITPMTTNTALKGDN